MDLFAEGQSHFLKIYMWDFQTFRVESWNVNRVKGIRACTYAF